MSKPCQSKGLQSVSGIHEKSGPDLHSQSTPTMLILLLAGLIFIVTTAVFWPACDGEFVDWDDQMYVYEEPHILSGISWEGICWASTASIASNWHPLTLISLQLDAQLFGSGPTGFHRTSVIIHALNSALLFLTFLSLTGGKWKSAILAGFFAIHPLRVESVAWVSERKDVLSGFFFLLTIFFYAQYSRRPSLFRYLLVLICHALGLASKSMLVTAPCVLMLLDMWPLRRWPASFKTDWRTIRNLICEKIPLLGLSVVASVIAINTQATAIAPRFLLTPNNRIANAALSYVVYLEQAFWPVALSPFYRHQQIPFWQFALALAILISITAIFAWQQSRRPHLMVGWLWYLGMLVPVIGIIQVGSQAHADRYTYLPHIGLCVLIVWTTAEMTTKSHRLSIAVNSLATVLLMTCGFLTIRQISVWRNTETLWRHAYRLDADNSVVLINLTRHLIKKGEHSAALEIVDKIIRSWQPSKEALAEELAAHVTDIVLSIAESGENTKISELLKKIFTDFPEITDIFSMRGKRFAAIPDWVNARNDFLSATQLSPDAVSNKFYLAHALEKLGDTIQAKQTYESALRQSPQWPLNAATIAWQTATNPAANQQSTLFARLDSAWTVCLAEQANQATGEKHPEIIQTVAAAYANDGRFADAVAAAKRALRLAESESKSEVASGIRQQLSFYERRQPFRQGRYSGNVTH